MKRFTVAIMTVNHYRKCVMDDHGCVPFVVAADPSPFTLLSLVALILVKVARWVPLVEQEYLIIVDSSLVIIVGKVITIVSSSKTIHADYISLQCSRCSSNMSCLMK